MSSDSFKKAFASQLKNGNTNLFYGHRFIRDGKQRVTEIMCIKADELDQIADKMKNTVEDKVRHGVLPWFTTNE